MRVWAPAPRTCASPAIPTWCRWGTRRRGRGRPSAPRSPAVSLYGRGAADMKGGVACFLAAALDYLNANGGLKRGSLSFLITGDEESVAINGTPKLLAWLKARGETLDACLVGEPASDEAVGDQIKIGRRGYRQRAADRPWQAGPFGLRRARREPHPEARAHHRPALDHAARQGHGALPALEPAGHDRVGAERGDQRDTGLGAGQLQHPLQRPAHPAQASRRGCGSTARSAAKEVGARFSLSFEGTGNVFLTKPGPLVDTMRAAIQGVTGREPALTTTGGTSDARFIKDFCPVVEVGLRNATAHQVDEHVAARRPRDADADLPPLHRALFCGLTAPRPPEPHRGCALPHRRSLPLWPSTPACVSASCCCSAFRRACRWRCRPRRCACGWPTAASMSAPSASSRWRACPTPSSSCGRRSSTRCRSRGSRPGSDDGAPGSSPRSSA